MLEKIPPPTNNKFINTGNAVVPLIKPNLDDDLATTHDGTNEVDNSSVVSNYVGSTTGNNGNNTQQITEQFTINAGNSTLNLSNIPTIPNDIKLFIDGILYETPEDFITNGTVLTITNQNILENITNQSSVKVYYV